MRVAIDTNVLAYAEGVGNAERRGVAIALVERLAESAVLLPAQVLGELMLVLTRKAGRTRELARDAVLGWADSFDVIDSTWAAFQSAFDLSVNHEFRMRDTLVMAVAGRVLRNVCRHVFRQRLRNILPSVIKLKTHLTWPDSRCKAAASGALMISSGGGDRGRRRARLTTHVGTAMLFMPTVVV